MSDNPQAAGDTPAPAATVQATLDPGQQAAAAHSASFSFLQSIVASGLHGAGVIYHRVLNAEAAVSKWVADNPAIAPLLREGEAAGVALLTAAGVPVPAIAAIGSAVISGLAQMAAADSTVGSGASNAAPPPT